MPFGVHVALVVVISAYFLFRYIKERQIYELLFLLWVPSTMLQYITSNPLFLKLLGIFQILMFLLVIFFMFRRRRYRAHKTAEILAKYATGDLDNAVEASNDNLNSLPSQSSTDKPVDKKEDTNS